MRTNTDIFDFVAVLVDPLGLEWLQVIDYQLVDQPVNKILDSEFYLFYSEVDLCLSFTLKRGVYFGWGSEREDLSSGAQATIILMNFDLILLSVWVFLAALGLDMCTVSSVHAVRL